MMPFDPAEWREFCERKARARQFANVGEPIPINRPTPVLHYHPETRDARPPALSRGPCPKCETRGEIGCAHQRPFVAGEAIPYERYPARWNRRRVEWASPA